jgi:hypothetical protein
MTVPPLQVSTSGIFHVRLSSLRRELVSTAEGVARVIRCRLAFEKLAGDVAIEMFQDANELGGKPLSRDDCTIFGDFKTVAEYSFSPRYSHLTEAELREIFGVSWSIGHYMHDIELATANWINIRKPEFDTIYAVLNERSSVELAISAASTHLRVSSKNPDVRYVQFLSFTSNIKELRLVEQDAPAT